jgi:hypothetical protein
MIENLRKIAIAIQILMLAAWCFDTYTKLSTKNPESIVTAVIPDTLKYKVLSFQNEIQQLKDQRKGLQKDTAFLYSGYLEILSRINNYDNNSDTAQLYLLRELLHKPDPKPVEVNQELAKGVLCQQLLGNSRRQLFVADSITKIQDTIIVTQKTQLSNCNKNFIEVRADVARQSLELTEVKSKLRGWRIFGLSQGIALAAALTIYKLSH